MKLVVPPPCPAWCTGGHKNEDERPERRAHLPCQDEPPTGYTGVLAQIWRQRDGWQPIQFMLRRSDLSIVHSPTAWICQPSDLQGLTDVMQAAHTDDALITYLCGIAALWEQVIADPTTILSPAA